MGEIRNSFLLVAATRYAIRRVPTGASMDVAVEVVRHADLIRSDAGAARAICEEVRSFVEEPKPSFVSDGEWREAENRWGVLAAALER